MSRKPRDRRSHDPEDFDVSDTAPEMTRGELLEILGELYAQDPTTVGEDMCQFCLSEVGEHHEPECLWLRAAQALGQGETASSRLVGEDEDEAAERAEDDADLEVLFPHHPAPASAPVDPFELVCENARAALEAGLLHPGALEPVRQAARIIDEPDDETLVPVVYTDDTDED